jgi:hypothetical protein
VGNEIRRNLEAASWQESLRTALYDGVGENDVAEIVRNITAKAKKGDLKAAEFLFRWTIGQQPKVVQQVYLNQHQPADRVVELGPRDADPSPEEIAERALAIRNGRNGLLRGTLDGEG